MAAPSPATVSAHDDVTAEYWATALWIGEMSVPFDRARVLDRLRAVRSQSTTIPADDVLDTAAVAVGLTRAAAEAGLGSARSAPRLSLHLCGPAHRTSLAYGTGAWQAWVYLAHLDPGDAHRDCGALTLHDPRSGCEQVTVPGLPWGRPLTVRPADGLTVVAPGWLGWSQIALAPGQRLAVLRADA